MLEAGGGFGYDPATGRLTSHVLERLIVAQRLEWLRAAIERYRQQHGAPPAALDVLGREGVTRVPPHPARDGRWVYDAATGRVTSDPPLRELDRSQTPP